jgi:hypothetical protein
LTFAPIFGLGVSGEVSDFTSTVDSDIDVLGSSPFSDATFSHPFKTSAPAKANIEKNEKNLFTRISSLG